LARKLHPDVSKETDSEVRFKELGEAYEVLKDPEKRAAYDQLGANWQGGENFRPPPDWDAGFEFSGGGDSANSSDFFESLFGQQGGPSAYQAGGHTRGTGFNARGEDHHAKVLIDIDDAFTGATRTFTLRVPKVTPDPDGHVRSGEHSLKVKIPKGIKPGQRIRLAGQGAPGMGQGPAGDLYLEVEFKPHALYRVDGADIYLNLPVTPWEAALGAKLKVPTPSGMVDLKIPANSSQGNKLRLKGRGLPAKQPGDLFVVITIALPPADSEEEKALYETMAEQMAFNPREQWEAAHATQK